MSQNLPVDGFQTLQKIMKQDLTLEIMNYTHHYLKEKRQK